MVLRLWLFRAVIEYHIRNAHKGIKEILLYLRLELNAEKERFAFQGALVFNKLPDDLKTEQSLLNFKYTVDDRDF